MGTSSDQTSIICYFSCSFSKEEPISDDISSQIATGSIICPSDMSVIN